MFRVDYKLSEHIRNVLKDKTYKAKLEMKRYMTTYKQTFLHSIKLLRYTT